MQLLFLPSWFSDEIVKATGWTLIHSLWQGLLAAVLAGIIIVSTRKSAARLRYNLLGVVIVLFLIVTVITFSMQLKGNVVAEKPFTDLTVPVTDNSFVAVNYEPAPVPVVTTVDRFVTYFNTNADLFVLLWAIFFLFHCIKLATGLAGIQRIRNYKTHLSPDEWLSKLQQLSSLLGIKQSVGLQQSELVKVPVAIGFFKPVILVPLGLLSHLPPDQVETILLHELAHIRRKDYIVNILQRITEAIFFFNPALLWISSLIRQEREACCDDIVVANTANRGSYLEALVSFQEYSLAASGYAMAVTSKRHYLLNRVKRMVTRENKKLDIMEKIFLLAGMLALTAFTFIPQKETTNKKNLTVVQPVKEAEEIKSAPGKVQAPPPASRKPRTKVVKEENRKPVQETPANILVKRDTVPPAKKEKTNYDDLEIENFSSNVDDNGGTKTETTTVTGKNGKRYSYIKVNNKVISLVVDGKSIAENEIGNYSPLFDKVEAVRQENKARRVKEKEKRNAENIAKRAEDMKRRTEDVKRRTMERDQQNENKRKLNQYILEQKRQLKSEENAAKKFENKKSQRLKQLEKMKRQLKYVPTINGREVIKNDIHLGNSATVSVNAKTDINARTVQLIKKTGNLKNDNLKNDNLNNDILNSKTTKKAFLIKSKPGIALEFNMNTSIQDELLKNFSYETDNVDVKLSLPQYTAQYPVNPNASAKESPDGKGVPPAAPKKKSLPAKRRVTT